MYKKITKERADEITAAWDAATDVQRLGMQRIQWLYVSGGNDETDYWEHEPPPLEKAAAARIAELEAALRDVMIGGNHCALLIGADHPTHTASHDDALVHYGAGDKYEAWCCWRTIMRARDVLERT